MKFLVRLASVLWVLLAGPVAAQQGTTVWESGDVAVDLWASVREILRYGHQTDAERFANEVIETLPGPTCIDAALFANCPAFDGVGERDAWQGLTRFRIGSEFRLGDMLSAVIVYDNELTYGTLDTLEAGLGAAIGGRETFLGAEGEVTSSRHFEWTQRLYRGYLRFETERVELIVGRQRVAWGVGRLWNPIDRFSAIGPLAIEGDQVQGIDSIDAKFLYDGFSYLELVYAPGTSRDRARYAARLHGVAFDADWSLMGGVFQKAPTVGVDFARNVGGAAFRFEVVYTDPEHEVWKIGDAAPDELGHFWQAVVSVDGTIGLGSGVTLLLEHLYNGNALGFGSGKAGTLLPLFEAAAAPALPSGARAVPGSIDLFGTSRVVSGSRNQTGVQASYDLLPELSVSALAIYDWDGESAAFFPRLHYAPLDFLDLTLGAQFFVGPRRSEYGNAQHQVYLLAEVFF